MVREDVSITGRIFAGAPASSAPRRTAAGETALELDLVQRAQRGDRRAGEVLVQRYEKLVRLQASRCIRHLRVTGGGTPR